MKKSNETKTNVTINFNDIEKSIATMVIGTKCSYTKYNDNKNGYIGVKYGNKNVFSMYHLRNENTEINGFSIGCTNDLFTVLNTTYKSNENIEFIKNGNSGDKVRNNKLVVKTIKLVYELYQFIITHYSTPQTTETK